MADEDNNIVKLLKGLLSPVQPLEEVLQHLKSERFIDTAIGTQLDIIGKLVGQLRNGMDDDTYRRHIRARIATHNSDGTVEDLLTIADLIVYDGDAHYVLKQEGTATARLRVDNIAIDATLGGILFDFIFDAKSGGVRVVVQWSEYPASQTFTLDTGPGLDVGHLSDDLG
jgi:hypothetical protein